MVRTEKDLSAAWSDVGVQFPLVCDMYFRKIAVVCGEGLTLGDEKIVRSVCLVEMGAFGPAGGVER
jgi:hypothetical protein